MLVIVVWKWIGRIAAKNDCEVLFEKLTNEMMIMGLVSISTYLFFDSSEFHDETTVAGEWYKGFHFSHLVAFFISIAYIVQALFFVKFMNIYGTRLASYEFSSPVEIIHSYNQLKDVTVKHWLYTSSFQYFSKASLFTHAFIPPPYELSMTMQIHMISQYFKMTHRLPSSFNFATYVTAVNRNFTMHLTEVAPLSWLILSLLVLINYVKIKGFDPYIAPLVCKSFATGMHGDMPCWQYDVTSILCYCAVFVLVNMLLWLMAVISMVRLFHLVLESAHLSDDPEGSNNVKRTGLDLLRRYLRTLGKQLDADNNVVDTPSGRLIFRSALAGIGSSHSIDLLTGSHFSQSSSGLNRQNVEKSVDSLFHSSYQKAEDVGQKLRNFITRLKTAMHKYLFGKHVHNNKLHHIGYDSVYLFGSPYFFFHSIEIVLLLQCVFMALLCTQFVAVVANNLDNPGLVFAWELALLTPLVISFFILQRVLSLASLLKSITAPDLKLCRSILQDIAKKKVIHDKVGKLIVRHLRKVFLENKSNAKLSKRESDLLRNELIELFKESAGTNEGMNKPQLRDFLTRFGIHIHHSEDLQTIYRSIDIDGSGDISWGEVAIICFPFENANDYRTWEEEHARFKKEKDNLDEHRRGSYFTARLLSIFKMNTGAVTERNPVVALPPDDSLGTLSRRLVTLRALAQEQGVFDAAATIDEGKIHKLKSIDEDVEEAEFASSSKSSTRSRRQSRILMDSITPDIVKISLSESIDDATVGIRIYEEKGNEEAILSREGSAEQEYVSWV